MPTMFVILATSAAFAVTLNLDPAAAGFDALAKRAAIAAHVRVVMQQHRLITEGKDSGRIVTDSTCEVLDAAYGAKAGDTLVITELGGYYGNFGQKVFGLEPLAPNDELAVFLSDKGYGESGRRIVGMNLGVYRVLDAPSLATTERPLVGYASYVFPGRDETPQTLGAFLSAAKAAGGR